MLLTDRAYEADSIRNGLKIRGGVAVIPARRTRRVRDIVDGHRHALHNRITRCFNFFKNARRVATCHDRTAASHLGFVNLAALRL